MNVPTIGANFEISGYEAVQCTGDPMKDAKNFADANGISVEEAKKVLSGQFGDPKVQEGSNSKTGEKVAASKDDDAELVEDAEKTGDGNTTFTLDELKDTIKEIVTELLKNLGLTTTTDNATTTTNNDTTNNIINEVNNQLNTNNTNTTTATNTTNTTDTTNNTVNATNNDTANTLTTAQQTALNKLSETFGYTLTGDNTTDITELNNRLGSLKYALNVSWENDVYVRHQVRSFFGVDKDAGWEESWYYCNTCIQEIEKAMAVLNGAVAS